MNQMWEGSNYEDYLYVGAQGWVMGQLHRRMEKPFPATRSFPLTVEVGAGEGQHFPYVRHRYERYVMTDVRPQQPAQPLPPNVEFQVGNAEDLPFAPGSIDRLVSTCVLHHLGDPERALRSWRASVRPGGYLTILLATDPGLAHRLGRHLTTRRAAMRLGIDYDLEMAREHRNHAGALMVQIERVFAADTVRYVGIPFPFKTWNFNYSSVYQVHKQP